MPEVKTTDTEPEQKPDEKSHVPVPNLDFGPLKPMKNGTYTVLVDEQPMKIFLTSADDSKVTDTDSDVVEEKPNLVVNESDYDNKTFGGINDGESSDLSKSYKMIYTAPPSSGQEVTLSDTSAIDTTIDLEGKQEITYSDFLERLRDQDKKGIESVKEGMKMEVYGDVDAKSQSGDEVEDSNTEEGKTEPEGEESGEHSEGEDGPS